MKKIDKSQELEHLSTQWQLSMRERIPAIFESLEPIQQFEEAFVLLNSEYRDVRDYAIAFATENDWQENEEWLAKLKLKLNGCEKNTETRFLQQLFILLAHCPSSYIQNFKSSLFEAFKSEDADLKYHALIALEQSMDESREYADLLVDSLKSTDAGLRIVASQGLARLKDKSKLDALIEAARYALPEEAFHILLARLALGEENLETELIAALNNDKTSYAAILALEKYGSRDCLEALASLWKSPFSEITLRITAARCAARFGSSEALELLKTLSSKKNGNPELAREALALLNKDS